MRTTVDIDEEKLRCAMEYADQLSRNALLNAALDAYIRQEAQGRIAAGALHQPDFKAPPRGRRP